MKPPISSTANCNSLPAVACARILSEKGLSAWWVGKVKVIDCDAAWPASGTKMSWRAGGGTFNAVITEDARPQRVVMEVVTPGANSLITHTFDLLPGGGTAYTKTVIPRPRSWMMKLIISLLILMVSKMVKIEVKRAAAYADAEPQ